MQHDLRVRKPITALTQNQRRAFFWCLKMMAILPPIPGKASHGVPTFADWNYETHADDEISPKNMHDVLMASHSTVCEHHSFFFGHYHRHLLVLVEVFMNFSHKILLHPDGIANLKSTYPNHPHIYADKVQEKWQAVFDTYKTFAKDFDFISLHYWAPTNFEDKDHVSIPPELYAPWNIHEEGESEEEAKMKDRLVDLQKEVDDLYEGITGSKPWGLGTAYRWRKDPAKHAEDHKSNPQELIRRFDSDYYRNIVNNWIPAEDKETIKLIREGKISPRSEYERFKQVKLDEGWKYSSYDMVEQMDKNFAHYKESGAFVLNNLTPSNIRVNYGAAQGGYQFISKKEEEEYNEKNPKEPMDANQYNNMLPHFQYADAYFTNKSVKDFFRDTEFEKSHDYMHDNLRFVFSDARFSLTSLLFFPYHAWVDVLLELFIRRMNFTPNGAGKLNSVLRREFRKTRSTSGVEGRVDQELSSTEYGWKHLTEILDRTMKWYRPDEKLDPKVVGYYPIPEYFSTLNNQLVFSTAFNAFDYMMNPNKTIRTTKELSPLYQKYMFADRFQGYPQFKNFPFDHDYQLFFGERLSDDNTRKVNLPRHLASMRRTILPHLFTNVEEERVQAETTRIMATQVVTSSSSSEAPAAPVLTGDKEPEFPPEVKTAKAPPPPEGQADDSEDEEQVTIRKIFKHNVMMFVKYKSNILNGFYPIRIGFKDMKEDVKAHTNAVNEKRIEQLLENGMVATNINVFGREQNAKKCPKCATFKELLLNFDLNFNRGAFAMWKATHLSVLNKVFFDSNKPDHKPKCFTDKVQLHSHPLMTESRLVTGATEIEVNVKFPGAKGKKEHIRLGAEVHSVSLGEVKQLVTKKKTVLNTGFDFMRIVDLDQGTESAKFDTYVYKKLKGYIRVESDDIEFEFDLPSYQRVLRLDVQVKREGKLHVVVEDHDYDIKKKYYESAQP